MTNIQFPRFPMLIAAAMTVLCLLPSTASAQLSGQNIKGDTGLKAGSQPPPGAYVAVPLWFYTADAVKDRDGNEILTGKLDASASRRSTASSPCATSGSSPRERRPRAPPGTSW